MILASPVPPVRVSVGEDDTLLRQGVVRVLREAGLDVVVETGDAVDLLAQTLAYRPDVAVVDIRMLPRHDDDGLRAAIELRERLGRPARPVGSDAVVIVVRLHDEAVSFLVDGIADVVHVDAADFEAPPDTLDGAARDLILGAYKLDGRLLLALDVARAVG